jgi:hypothetical protein
MSSREMEWEKLPIQGQLRPPPRWKHTATLLDSTRLLVFGGYRSTMERLNDVWVSHPTRLYVKPLG